MFIVFLLIAACFLLFVMLFKQSVPQISYEDFHRELATMCKYLENDKEHHAC